MATIQWNGMGIYANQNLHRVEEVSSSAKKQKMNSLEEHAQYSNLTRYSNEKCLYCCRLFFNKLQLYMHNTRHLYIPVEKQQLSEVILNTLNTSQNLVSNNTPMESPTISKQIKKIGYKKMLSKTYKNLQDKKEKELDREILNHKDNLLKDLMTDCKVNLGENIQIRIVKETRKEIRIDKETRKEVRVDKDTKKEPKNAILSNFTNNCIVHLNDFFSTIQKDTNNVLKDRNLEINEHKSYNDTSHINAIKKVFVNKNITVKRVFPKHNEDNKIITVHNTKTEESKSEDTSLNMLLVGKKQDNSAIHEAVSKSRDSTVAYHTLVKDVKKGVLCNICSKPFTNRYKAILHESRHIALQIPRIDIYLNNKPYRCICLEKFDTLKQYSKHAEHCTLRTYTKNPNSVTTNKKNKLLTEREMEKSKILPIDKDFQSTLKIKREKAWDKHKTIIDNDVETIDFSRVDFFSKTKRGPKHCPYCKSDTANCSDECSVIRSDVMRSGNSTYFCKECFSKMEANLTKVGMYNGKNFNRRCVVCNSAGKQFVLAFMTAECVLGI